MKKVRLTIPEISLIASTRVVLGGGLAFLFADRLKEKERKALGWALFLAGAATTVPLARMILDRRTSERRHEKELKEELEAKAQKRGWRKRLLHRESF